MMDGWMDGQMEGDQDLSSICILNCQEISDIFVYNFIVSLNVIGLEYNNNNNRKTLHLS